MIETESYRKKNSDVNITSFIDQGSRDVLLRAKKMCSSLDSDIFCLVFVPLL